MWIFVLLFNKFCTQIQANTDIAHTRLVIDQHMTWFILIPQITNDDLQYLL